MVNSNCNKNLLSCSFALRINNKSRKWSSYLIYHSWFIQWRRSDDFANVFKSTPKILLERNSILKQICTFLVLINHFLIEKPHTNTISTMDSNTKWQAILRMNQENGIVCYKKGVAHLRFTRMQLKQKLVFSCVCVYWCIASYWKNFAHTKKKKFWPHEWKGMTC